MNFYFVIITYIFLNLNFTWGNAMKNEEVENKEVENKEVEKLKNCLYTKSVINKIYKNGNFTNTFYWLVKQCQIEFSSINVLDKTKTNFRESMQKLECGSQVHDTHNLCLQNVAYCCNTFVDDLSRSPLYYGKEFGHFISSTVINNVKKIIPFKN
ncbi:uncharacterized protein LOC126904064 isoform X2 [Daktulosphaira vitifoliae]|uniref:uncharacterized protein LOC126904064 isoform X1 n=1 Tax=Daktulosphaira vitifoliae TaxID=58002 RepID=UPI0021AA4C62|nr:uncharacterized protein LOC126904064 isoform X1 [Daktulosphaira vitifoliae]XP_050538668.1 uncharacterized protein LOC126904064 isoform X2 [Daktulosphaira vitifoliae]